MTIFSFDSSFYPFSPSPLFFSLYKCVNLFGCPWLLRELFHHQSRGFVFCGVWPMKSYYCKGSGLNPRGRRLYSRTSGPPENSWPYRTLISTSSPQNLYLNTKTRFHSKVSWLQWWMSNANHYKTCTQSGLLADRLPKATPNPKTRPKTTKDTSTAFQGY